MSVGNGTRPGSKPEQVYPGWDYVCAQGPSWQELRKVNREIMRWEDEMNKALAAADKLTAALSVAYVLMHGGHVERGTLAKSGLRPEMEAAAVIAHVRGLLIKDVPALR